MFRMILVLSLAYSIPAFAQRRQGGPGGGPNPACQKIREACEKAGYRGRGGPSTPDDQSPGTIRDCMTKWNSGGTIAGLTIKPTDATGKPCVEHMKKMKERGGPGGRRGGPGPGAGAAPGRVGVAGSVPSSPPPPTKSSPVAPAAPASKAPAVLPPIPQTTPPKK